MRFKIAAHKNVFVKEKDGVHAVRRGRYILLDFIINAKYRGPVVVSLLSAAGDQWGLRLAFLRKRGAVSIS